MDNKTIGMKSLLEILGSIPETLLFEIPDAQKEYVTVDGICKGYSFIVENLGRDFSERDLFHLNTLIRGGFSTYTGFNPNPYRSTQARVLDFSKDPPNPTYVPLLMNQILYLLSDDSNLSPLEKAALAQGGIQYVQPFEDGNKRTGRLMSDKILLENGFRLPMYNHRKSYIEMLEGVYNGISTLVKSKDHLQIFDSDVYKPLVDFLKENQ